MEYSSIFNPNTNRYVSIQGKIGKKLIIKYLNELQHGGKHNGPCKISNITKRCIKGRTWDNNNCELSAKGNCARKKKTKSSAKINNLFEKVDPNEVIPIPTSEVPQQQWRRRMALHHRLAAIEDAGLEDAGLEDASTSEVDQIITALRDPDASAHNTALAVVERINAAEEQEEIAKELEDERSIAWSQEQKHKRKQSAAYKPAVSSTSRPTIRYNALDNSDDSVTSEEIANIRTNKMTKKQLVDVCMKMGLIQSGTKTILINRILDEIAKHSSSGWMLSSARMTKYDLEQIQQDLKLNQGNREYQECIVRKEKKYNVRNSPPILASTCPEGMIYEGNDGTPYRVFKPDSKGKKIWIPLN